MGPEVVSIRCSAFLSSCAETMLSTVSIKSLFMMLRSFHLKRKKRAKIRQKLSSNVALIKWSRQWINKLLLATLVFAFKLWKGLGEEEEREDLSISAFFDFDLLSQQGQNSVFSALFRVTEKKKSRQKKVWEMVKATNFQVDHCHEREISMHFSWDFTALEYSVSWKGLLPRTSWKPLRLLYKDWFRQFGKKRHLT